MLIIPHPLGRFAGYVFQAGGAISNIKLRTIEASLAKNAVQLQEFEKELKPLENEMKNLEVEYIYAKEKFEQCKAGQ